MVYKLAKQAEKHGRKLNKQEYMALVLKGVQFVNGIMASAA